MKMSRGGEEDDPHKQYSFSRLLSHVFCLLFPVSCLLPPVSRLQSQISSLRSLVSCLTSPVSGVQQCAQISWIVWPQSPSLSSNFLVFLIITPGYFNRPRMFIQNLFRKQRGNGANQHHLFFAPLPPRHFFILAPPRRACATFFSSRQWRGGAKSGAR